MQNTKSNMTWNLTECLFESLNIYSVTVTYCIEWMGGSGTDKMNVENRAGSYKRRFCVWTYATWSEAYPERTVTHRRYGIKEISWDLQQWYGRLILIGGITYRQNWHTRPFIRVCAGILKTHRHFCWYLFVIRMGHHHFLGTLIILNWWEKQGDV